MMGSFDTAGQDIGGERAGRIMCGMRCVLLYVSTVFSVSLLFITRYSILMTLLTVDRGEWEEEEPGVTPTHLLDRVCIYTWMWLSVVLTVVLTSTPLHRLYCTLHTTTAHPTTHNMATAAARQAELRQLMAKAKQSPSPSTPTVSSTITSSATHIQDALARYDANKQLSCIICKVAIKKDSEWKLHIQSKQHVQVSNRPTCIPPCSAHMSEVMCTM